MKNEILSWVLAILFFAIIDLFIWFAFNYQFLFLVMAGAAALIAVKNLIKRDFFNN
jgi:hypothetical protein